MIDLILYRFRIGNYAGGGGWGKVSRALNNAQESKFNCPFMQYEENSSSKSIDNAMLMIFYGYFITLFTLIALSHVISLEPTRHIYLSKNIYLNSSISHFSLAHIKLAYFYLLSYVLGRTINGKCDKFWTFKKSSRLLRLISNLILALVILNFLLIGICNPSLLNPGPNKLKVYFHNVQGLIPFSYLSDPHPKLDSTKIYELNTYIKLNRPDVVMLNETWLKKSIGNHEVINDKTYKVFRNDRTRISHPVDSKDPKKFREYGGGVLVAVRQDIDGIDIRELRPCKGAEMVAAEITLNDKKFIFSTIYRVLNLGEANHNSIIKTIKSYFKVRNPRKIFIAGDLNLNEISWPLSEDIVVCNKTQQLFLDSFHELGLTQCINEPTHSKGRTLDLILTNNDGMMSNVNVLPRNSVIKSDHFPIEFDVNTKFKYRPVPKRKIYNFKLANWDKLNLELSKVHWEDFVDGIEPEIAWQNFKTILFLFVDQHIPKITLKCTFSYPWFDSECYEAYKDKERAHGKKKGKDLDPAKELNFSTKRRAFKNMCNKKMRDNLYNGDDPNLITKKFWSHVKSTSKSHRIPECIHRNNTFRNKPEDKAELFNTYFFDQFSCPSNYNIDIDWSHDHSNDIDFSPSKIGRLLSNINSNKAHGPDGIHGQVLKHCARTLAFPLSLLFKLSYNTGFLPKEWKIANVVPVHKKGAKDDVENYRPISLTCLIMKTFERIIKDELLSRSQHLLDERQHGFLSQKSCTSNMALFSDNIVMSINDCKTMSIDVVYFDFSKAFDSVNHDLMLQKLKQFYGIDGRLLKFIRNYLSGREQCVIMDSIKSTYKSVTSGVPQGSILGPILFVLFINDLPQGINTDTNISLYADDTKMWRQITSYTDIVKLQKDIDVLHDWSFRNLMKFHPKKCKLLSIKNKLSPLAMLPFVSIYYSLGSNFISYVDIERDLGVYVSESFSFNDHCEKLITKTKQQFGILRRTCHFVNDSRRRRVLYLTLIRSHFEHCSQIWRPTGKTSLFKFESFQKKCLKWILLEEELSYHSHATYLRKCQEANILPMFYKFLLNDLVLFHKVSYEHIPLRMPSYLTFFNGISRLRSCRLDRLCYVSSVFPKGLSTNNLDKSFFYRTHSLWNNVPLEHREIRSVQEFKGRIIKYLWKLVSEELKEELDNSLSCDT